MAQAKTFAAARLQAPGSEWRVLRALQLAYFTSDMVLEDLDALRAAIEGVDGIDADAVMAAIDDPHVRTAYEADRAETRTAAGTPGATVTVSGAPP